MGLYGGGCEGFMQRGGSACFDYGGQWDGKVAKADPGPPGSPIHEPGYPANRIEPVTEDPPLGEPDLPLTEFPWIKLIARATALSVMLEMIDQPAGPGTPPKDTVVIGRSEDVLDFKLSSNEFSLMNRMGNYGTAANMEINRATFSALLQRGIAVRDIFNGTAASGTTLAMEREVMRQFGYVRSWAGSEFWVPPR